ncbi:MAG: hypothetical protein ACWA5P_09145 [bacterium]
MKRVIIDYRKLTPEILTLLNNKFPDGYGDNDIITFSIPNKDIVEAVEIKTSDTIYLVKVGSKLRDSMNEFMEDNDEAASSNAFAPEDLSSEEAS